MRRALVIFATLALLWTVVAELNHTLSSHHIFLWLAGLYVTYGALTLPFRTGVTVAFLGGLLCDSAAPVAFGTHALLFSAANAVIFNIRDRVPRDETVARVIIALLTNLTLFLVFSFLQISRLPQPAVAWPRIIFDLVCSQVVLALIAPWFFALQAAALRLAEPFAAPIRRNAD